MRRLFLFLGLFFLLADTGFSLLQHLQMPLDGDLAGIVLPSAWYSEVLRDPFGFSVLWEGKRYAATNRFFVHWFMGVYFRQVPLFLQHFTDPVGSVYLAAALLKTGIQVGIAWLLAAYISGTGNPLRKGFLLAAVLVVPLFQHTAYGGTMGVISQSVTYTCFYSLPLGVLLLFLLPFYRAWQKGGGQPLHWSVVVVLPVLAVVLAFSGPLGAPAGLLAGGLGLAGLLKRAATDRRWLSELLQPVPRPLLYTGTFFMLLCLYTLYIGQFNLENETANLPLWERYARLPAGLFNLLTIRLGLPLLVSAVALNGFLLHRQQQLGDEQAAVVLRILKGLALFSVFFILLLPLGGYREYRPNLIRQDTLLPVILCLVFGFGLSAFRLLQVGSGLFRKRYSIFVVAVLAVFTLADASLTRENRCEKAALETIARSQEPVVRLSNDCRVLSWVRITDPRDSEMNGRLLLLWQVTPELRLYYQE
ncbi:MAG: hypothetical protein EP344_13015 [Bacteroidetes bacterium]|nr:MAG: hypothetical protein EP344_13015 [Bacteroidota bacterium]